LTSPVYVARSGGGRSGSSEAVIFVQDSVELRGSTPSGPKLDNLLAEWTQADPPIWGDVIGLVVVSFLPLSIAAIAYTWHLLSNEMPVYATFPWLGMAVLVYVALGIKILLHLLRKKKRSVG
jgi:hypothetical protein